MFVIIFYAIMNYFIIFTYIQKCGFSMLIVVIILAEGIRAPSLGADNLRQHLKRARDNMPVEVYYNFFFR
jgi:hypothetical protein